MNSWLDTLNMSVFQSHQSDLETSAYAREWSNLRLRVSSEMSDGRFILERNNLGCDAANNGLHPTALRACKLASTRATSGSCSEGVRTRTVGEAGILRLLKGRV